MKIGKDCPEPFQLDFINTQPNRRIAFELFLQADNVFVENITDGLLVNADLLGNIRIGVFECLAANPTRKAFGHFAPSVHFRHRGRESLVARAALQARHVQMNDYRLAVSRNIPNYQLSPGVANRFIGSSAVRTKPRNGNWHCFNVILGLRFLKVGDVETGEVEEVDRHRNALPQPSSRER